MGAEVKSMEIKKTQQTASKEQALAKEQMLSTKRLQNFVADIKSEIHKITWTSREELIAYTKIVILTTFVFGMSIYLLDLCIQSILNGLNLILRLISG